MLRDVRVTLGQARVYFEVLNVGMKCHDSKIEGFNKHFEMFWFNTQYGNQFATNIRIVKRFSIYRLGLTEN